MFKLFSKVKAAEEEGEGEGEESETRVAVHSVQVFGHKYNQVELSNIEFLNSLEKIAELPNSEGGGDNVEGGVVLVKVLSFLATMLRDLGILHKRRKAASLDPTLVNVSPCDYATISYVRTPLYSIHMRV